MPGKVETGPCRSALKVDVHDRNGNDVECCILTVLIEWLFPFTLIRRILITRQVLTPVAHGFRACRRIETGWFDCIQCHDCLFCTEHEEYQIINQTHFDILFDKVTGDGVCVCLYPTPRLFLIS